MSILALDFDGVLWDSVGEAYHVAVRAHENLFGPVPQDLEKPFRAARWLVRTGREFLVALRLAGEDPSRDFASFPKAEFAARKREWQADLVPFETEFYRVREQLRTQEPDLWMSWQGPYHEMVEALPLLEARVEQLAIATTKDEESVQRLLETVGWKLPIVGRDFGTDKGEQIRRLSAEHRVPLEQIRFLDDLLHNLDQVIPTGAGVALAAWGYNTPAERQAAKEQGIPVLFSAGDVVGWIS